MLSNADFKNLLNQGDSSGKTRFDLKQIKEWDRQIENQSRKKGPSSKKHLPENEEFEGFKSKSNDDKLEYRDRALERRKGVVSEESKLEEIVATLDAEQTKFLGGDLEHTHLVKGLDYALFRKLRDSELKEKNLESNSQQKNLKEILPISILGMKIKDLLISSNNPLSSSSRPTPAKKPPSFFLNQSPSALHISRTSFEFCLPDLSKSAREGEEKYGSELPITITRAASESSVDDSSHFCVLEEAGERVRAVFQTRRQRKTEGGREKEKEKEKGKERLKNPLPSSRLPPSSLPPPPPGLDLTDIYGGLIEEGRGEKIGEKEEGISSKLWTSPRPPLLSSTLPPPLPPVPVSSPSVLSAAHSPSVDWERDLREGEEEEGGENIAHPNKLVETSTTSITSTVSSPPSSSSASTSSSSPSLFSSSEAMEGVRALLRATAQRERLKEREKRGVTIKGETSRGGDDSEDEELTRERERVEKQRERWREEEKGKIHRNIFGVGKEKGKGRDEREGEALDLRATYDSHLSTQYELNDSDEEEEEGEGGRRGREDDDDDRDGGSKKERRRKRPEKEGGEGGGEGGKRPRSRAVEKMNSNRNQGGPNRAARRAMARGEA